MSKGKRYQCPYCDYRDYRAELIDHVEEEHEDMIPKNYTASRVVYNAINKKVHGSCMICHKETKWDEDKQRYDTLCGNPKCKSEYVKIVRSRMVKKYGTHNLLTDPEFQKKMLENRSISGKYKFEDGGSVGYVGSYEKKFLEFMDKFLHIKSYDIISPGPNIPYTYKGKEHVWITDFIYEPYNLVFDIKDGGDNPNTRDMKDYREKQTAKEKAIAEYGDYNYIRLTDNKFEQLISIFMELKEKVDDKPLIRINESTLEEAMSSKERNELDDDDFGIPELRKYPIHDKKHVEQAIKMFNHVEKKYESELADNLLDAMERYHISTDVVGDKNRLKKYIKEETTYVSEGLIWNDNTPQDIKDLRDHLKDLVEDKSEVKGLDDVIDKVKDSIKNKDFTSEEKKLVINACNKVNVKVHGYTLTTANYGSVEITNTHQIIGTYKNYILTIKFLAAKGSVTLPVTGLLINYNADKCDIPKNVVFDFISILSPNVDKVKSTKHSIRISALSNAIESGYPRISHKYSNKYKVKKNIGGMSISLSTLKSVKESSPIMGAMPRQDYNPNNVYIINYTKKNTFTEDMAICGDNMSNIFIYDNGNGPKFVSLTDFKEMADNVEVYKFLGEGCFNNILEFTNSEFNFYQNMVSNANNIKTDPRFIRVPSYIDELNSIEECIINSAPKTDIINEVYCPIIPLINLNESGSSVHYFRDINGVFAQNIDTLNRSASYKSVEDIPETTINILKNI